MYTDIQQVSNMAKRKFVKQHSSECVIDSDVLVRFITLDGEGTT